MQYARGINSFIVRNRRLSNQQQEVYNRGYLNWGLDITKNWVFSSIFSNNNNVILEIGFGQGDTLINNAVDNPDYNYIGVEVYQAGLLNIVGRLEDVENFNIKNIRVCNGDAKVVLNNCILDHSLAGVQIFFPDPWPKRRHHKRRLINSEFIGLLAKKIQSGGFIHLATDWADYAAQMLQVVTANSNYINLSADQGYYNNNNRLLTKFEQRGIKRGYDIFDLKFKII